MKTNLRLTATESKTIDFDPAIVNWKSQNYGQFSYNGVYINEIQRKVFVKRLKHPPLSMQFLRSLLERPYTNYLPAIYSIALDETARDGFRYYLFFEQLEGVTLSELKGKIRLKHCHEILTAIFEAMRSITERDFWHPDLDIKNIFIGKGESAGFVRLIDLDSCMPLSMMFADYLQSAGRRPNVNEKYWSYLVSNLKEDQLSKLSGISLSQSALMYFAVELFFFVKFPEQRITLTPEGLGKMMLTNNSRYFSPEAVTAWRNAHKHIMANPTGGAGWERVDSFITAAYRFPKRLRAKMAAGSPLSIFAKSAGRLFGSIFGK